MDYSIEQQIVCEKYNAPFVASIPSLKVGIARNIKDLPEVINGLRHPLEGDTTGWYIWGGEEFSNEPNFFMPMHVEHLKDFCPEVIKFLGLAPGWRFLIANDYEDVWEDKSLLDV